MAKDRCILIKESEYRELQSKANEGTNTIQLHITGSWENFSDYKLYYRMIPTGKVVMSEGNYLKIRKVLQGVANSVTKEMERRIETSVSTQLATAILHAKHSVIEDLMKLPWWKRNKTIKDRYKNLIIK